MTRTSASSVRVAPSGSYCLSWSTRRRRTCKAWLTSPISSSNRVPPRARAKRPGLSLVAPVKAPALYPKSSDSSSVSGSAPQLTATNGPSRRPLSPWMARATSSLPVPVSPWSRIVLSLSAIRGSTSSSRRIEVLRLTMSPTWKRPLTWVRSSSMMLRSRKVSAPPTTVPCSSRSRAVETLIGIRLPAALMMNVALFTTAAPLSMVCRSAHSASHMLARNTSEQRRPMASSREMPVISSAARLNDSDAPVLVHGEDAVRDALEDRFGRAERRARGRRTAPPPGAAPRRWSRGGSRHQRGVFSHG